MYSRAVFTVIFGFRSKRKKKISKVKDCVPFPVAFGGRRTAIFRNRGDFARTRNSANERAGKKNLCECSLKWARAMAGKKRRTIKRKSNGFPFQLFSWWVKFGLFEFIRWRIQWTQCDARRWPFAGFDESRVINSAQKIVPEFHPKQLILWPSGRFAVQPEYKPLGNIPK